MIWLGGLQLNQAPKVMFCFPVCSCIFLFSPTPPFPLSSAHFYSVFYCSCLPFFLQLCSFSPHLFSLYFPSFGFISCLSTSNLRDGLENVLWHFFHHLGPILSSSAWTPRPLHSILFTYMSAKHYPAVSAIPICLLTASLYSGSPTCTSQNLPTQCRIRYQSSFMVYCLFRVRLLWSICTVTGWFWTKVFF